MEGEPLLVHAPESVELGDKSLAWIAGQEGKDYTVHCVIKRKRNVGVINLAFLWISPLTLLLS